MTALKALIIGNSDGIGLAITRRLINTGWNVVGVSKSESPLKSDLYRHLVADVSSSQYQQILQEVLQEYSPDLCIYSAGIGEPLDLQDMTLEPQIVDVNLTGMVRTAAEVIPVMIKDGHGHFIGISSVADELLSSEAPSYRASKAGFSNYLESLALALKSGDVQVTNVRFGFVDTKMAKGDVKPFMISVEKAVTHLEQCIKKRPVRHTAPRIVIPLIKFRKLMMRMGAN